MIIDGKKIIDTAEDFDWLDDEDGSKLNQFLSDCERDGFTKVPDDHPVGIDGWAYRYFGMLAYYRKQ